MITLTTLRDVRCSLRPERIVSVGTGSPTTVLLDSGLSVEVRESAEEVKSRLEAARAKASARAAELAHGHGRAH